MNLLALFLALAAGSGRLCLAPVEQRVEATARCLEVKGGRVDIAPAPHARAFVWTRGVEAAVGVLGAGEGRVEFGGVGVEIATEGATVEMMGISAALPRDVRKLHVPEDARELRVSAPHHHPAPSRCRRAAGSCCGGCR